MQDGRILARLGRGMDGLEVARVQAVHGVRAAKADADKDAEAGRVNRGGGDGRVGQRLLGRHQGELNGAVQRAILLVQQRVGFNGSGCQQGMGQTSRDVVWCWPDRAAGLQRGGEAAGLVRAEWGSDAEPGDEYPVHSAASLCGVHRG